MENMIENLKNLARASWEGRTGEDRATQLEKFVRAFVSQYAQVLGMSELEVLTAIESKRTYSAINYYQEANFPSLEGVKVFDTQAEFLAAIPSKQFRCPSCKGVSTNAYECNAESNSKKKKKCDWKSYGFLRTCGMGVRVVVKEGFLDHPEVHEIFMPLEFEAEAQAASGKVAA